MVGCDIAPWLTEDPFAGVLILPDARSLSPLWEGAGDKHTQQCYCMRCIIRFILPCTNLWGMWGTFEKYASLLVQVRVSSCHTSGNELCCKIRSICPSPELAWDIQAACTSVLLALLLGCVCPHWSDPTSPDPHRHPVDSSSEHFCKYHTMELPLVPFGAGFLLQIIVSCTLHTSLEWASPSLEGLEVSCYCQRLSSLPPLLQLLSSLNRQLHIGRELRQHITCNDTGSMTHDPNRDHVPTCGGRH